MIPKSKMPQIGKVASASDRYKEMAKITGENYNVFL